MEAIVLIGRILLSVIFINSGIAHLTKTNGMAQYGASQGLPAAKFFVIVSGLMILAGGLMVLVGFEGKIGALLIFLFLVPTAFIMHRFWGVPDAMMAATQQSHFMKNIALAGA